MSAPSERLTKGGKHGGGSWAITVLKDGIARDSLRLS